MNDLVRARGFVGLPGAAGVLVWDVTIFLSMTQPFHPISSAALAEMATVMTPFAGADPRSVSVELEIWKMKSVGNMPC